MTSNTTHRKRLARAHAEQAGITYQQALRAVTAAAGRGALPARLDAAGMQAALRILATSPAGPTQATATMTWTCRNCHAPLHRASYDEGYAPLGASGERNCARRDPFIASWVEDGLAEPSLTLDAYVDLGLWAAEALAETLRVNHDAHGAEVLLNTVQPLRAGRRTPQSLARAGARLETVAQKIVDWSVTEHDFLRDPDVLLAAGEHLLEFARALCNSRQLGQDQFKLAMLVAPLYLEHVSGMADGHFPQLTAQPPATTDDPRGTEAPATATRQRARRRPSGELSNEQVRQAVERNVHPADLPVPTATAEAAAAPEAPDERLTGGVQLGGPYTSRVADADGEWEQAQCGVCKRTLDRAEPWWTVKRPGMGWRRGIGVVCAEHRPDLLPNRNHPDAKVGTLIDPSKLGSNLLVEAPGGLLLQISTIYEGRVTAQIVLPVPGRTTVRAFSWDEVARWRKCSPRVFREYEIAYSPGS